MAIIIPFNLVYSLVTLCTNCQIYRTLPRENKSKTKTFIIYNSINMRWSENETYRFVKIYLRHDCLWNYENVSYKMKDKRQRAYHDVITEFQAATGIQLNDYELKVKVKNLRSTYTQELRKMKVRADVFYTPAMRWFPEWHNCFNSMKRNAGKREDSTFEPQEMVDEANQKVWVPDNETDAAVVADPFVSQAVDEYVILKAEPREALHSQNNTDIFDVQKKKLEHRSSSTDISERTFRGSMDSASDSGTREDEFDIYGKYIAAQLRKMDLQKALRVQLEIQSIVSEARISGLSTN